jgi:hypothetical protein
LHDARSVYSVPPPQERLDRTVLPGDEGGAMYENDPTIEYIDIADEVRLIAAIEALARALESEPVR